jgi:hypothetical protein
VNEDEIRRELEEGAEARLGCVGRVVVVLLAGGRGSRGTVGTFVTVAVGVVVAVVARRVSLA